jgi:hypothetical protein
VTLGFDPTITVAVNQYVEVESDLFPVTPGTEGYIVGGDTILVTITRSAVDAYAGELGLLRVGAVFN